MNKFNKILLYQYGKVGSTSISYSCNGKHYSEICVDYPEYLIHTHSHDVGKDILKKYKNILVINIVRFIIDYNLSSFWENIHFIIPNYKEKSIEELNYKFKEIHNINYTDNWIKLFFEVIDINFDNFNFDKNNKYVILNKNENTYLFYRYEDYNYINENIFPLFNIKIETQKNNSFEKEYSKFYKNHKEFYKIDNEEEIKIKDNLYINKFYSNKHLNELITKYK